MEYTEYQLTEWETDHPKINGVYQTLSYGEGNIGYQKFVNGYWYGWRLTPEDADLVTNKVFHEFNNDKWRGLNFNPNAPKPKKGNKRKTMYVVMARVGIGHYPMACFFSKLNAENYLDNCKASGEKPEWLRIEKIRFRTPEHD